MRQIARTVLSGAVWLLSSALIGGLTVMIALGLMQLLFHRSSLTDASRYVLAFLLGTVGYLMLYCRDLGQVPRANAAMGALLLAGGGTGLYWYVHPGTSGWLLAAALLFIVSSWLVRHFYLEFERRGRVYRVKYR